MFGSMVERANFMNHVAGSSYTVEFTRHFTSTHITRGVNSSVILPFLQAEELRCGRSRASLSFHSNRT